MTSTNPVRFEINQPRAKVPDYSTVTAPNVRTPWRALGSHPAKSRVKNTRAPVLVLCLGALGCRADLPPEVARWQLRTDCGSRVREIKRYNPHASLHDLRELRNECILTERMRTFVASHQSCQYSSECALIDWGCSGASVRRDFVTAFEDKFAFARALIPRRTCCGAGPPPLEATCRAGHCIPVK